MLLKGDKRAYWRVKIIYSKRSSKQHMGGR